VREAFKDLLKGWGRSLELTFVPEYEIETKYEERLYSIASGSCRRWPGSWRVSSLLSVRVMARRQADGRPAFQVTAAEAVAALR
jgi:hypothetical protein